jgi:glycosyltransferase involved in cell wall biosynthesis
MPFEDLFGLTPWPCEKLTAAAPAARLPGAVEPSPAQQALGSKHRQRAAGPEPEMIAKKSPALRVLMEMRPAFDGHAGIPQETRLLFRALGILGGIELEGLLQGSNRVLAAGLQPGERAKRIDTEHLALDRLGRVVISLEEDFRFSNLRAAAATAVMALRHITGGREKLGRFDAKPFADYIWRRLFAATLPPGDFEVVTQARYRIARVPWNLMHLCALLTRYLGYALYPRLDTSDFDLMISETPFPASVSRNTQLIVRYHDAIPLLMPHTISDRFYHQAFHYGALRKNAANGAWFVCVSEATRKDLLSVFPQVERRALTIHNMVSHHYFNENSSPSRIPEIIDTRSTVKNGPSARAAPTPLEYLLIVSTIEPRKNHLGLLGAWESLHDRYPALKLVVVGKRGWHSRGILKKFEYWVRRGDVFLLQDVPAGDLRLLYKHASATVCPSFGEGFDFSGVEAMISGGVVAASNIPVHREVYGDAAEFLNPYAGEEVERAIHALIDPANRARRDELVRRGAQVSSRYTADAILPQWVSFLNSVAPQGTSVVPEPRAMGADLT